VDLRPPARLLGPDASSGTRSVSPQQLEGDESARLDYVVEFSDRRAIRLQDLTEEEMQLILEVRHPDEEQT
jgi:hypothetical protein